MDDTSLATVRGPRPGAGIERPALSLKQINKSTANRSNQTDARRSRSEGEDAANGSPNFQGCFRTHNNMHAGTLGFHELQTIVSSTQDVIRMLHTPARVVVAGRDISVGSRPIANSVSALLVAFMLANSNEPSSLRSSKPPAIITFALPDKIVSQAISSDCRAVALKKKVKKTTAKKRDPHSPCTDGNLHRTARRHKK